MSFNDTIKIMLKAQEELRKQLAPVFETLNASVEIPMLAKSVRLALDSTEMSQIVNLVSSPNKDLLKIQDMLQASEKQFKLPALEEANRLLTGLSRVGFSYALKDSEFSRTLDLVRDAISSMHTPWVDSKFEQKSFNDFARLIEIGHALGTMPVYDLNLTKILRSDLGDWRHEINWPSEIFDDVIARSDFYAERGFNSGLTAFPSPAFQQGLKLAGLCEPEDSLSHFYERAAEQEGEGFNRTVKAFAILFRLEVRLRGFIVERMEKEFGPKWIKNQVSGALRAKWKVRLQKDLDHSEDELPLIYYADLGDCAEIIIQKDNWKRVFIGIFMHKELVQESFRRLHPIRNDTMHARRLLSQDDELLLLVESKRLNRAMKDQS